MAQNDGSEGEDKAASRLRQTPLSWPELKSIILSSNEDNLSKLARSNEQKAVYRRRRAEIRDEWCSIYDYLLHTQFGFDWAWADVPLSIEGCKQRQKRSKPTFQQYIDEQQQRKKEGKECTTKLKLSLNDFPYYFEPGIQHFVLWKLGGEVTPEEISQAKLDIWNGSQSTESIPSSSDQKTPDNIETACNGEQVVNNHELFLHWINPPHLKSLPGIDHVHILFQNGGRSHL